MNLLTKTKPWIVASLLVATSVYAQDTASCAKPCPKPECAPKCCPPPCPQPCPPKQVCPACPPSPCCPPWYVPVLNAAYNYPARVETRCPWDVNVDVGYILWQPLQENMELGTVFSPSAYSITGGSTLTNPTALISGNVINLDAKYKSGFTVSLGMNFDFDDWDVQADYYWFHNHHSQSTFDCNYTTVDGTNAAPFANGGITPSWGFGRMLTNSDSFAIFQSASEKWKLGMDIIDLNLGRWYYVGRKLTFRPSVGARAAFIRQQLDADYSNGSITITSLSSPPYSVVSGLNVSVTNKSHSWAVGPSAGLETNWMLGSGFRLFGNGSGDLLFTRYTRLSTKQSDSLSIDSPDLGLASRPQNMSIKQKKYNTVRTHLDLELGFGWGTYFDCNNWYLDFAAGYGFQVFFDQNMFRKYTDDVQPTVAFSPNGNLYVHGLTATFRLDF